MEGTTHYHCTHPDPTAGMTWHDDQMYKVGRLNGLECGARVTVDYRAQRHSPLVC